MRLLDTTTKQLKTFYGKQIPKYVILSHMWGAEENEVLYRHMIGSDDDRRDGEKRKGHAKIEGACKQAIKDGWKYIWIDTCCIDKESSAELSEAINSMYEWYWNSEVCYVYLEDVQSGAGGVQSESDKDAMFPIVPFERSRWFSRGWTLQELIAPRYVVFYSRDWVDIGTKTGPLRDTISVVTRIRVEMLIAYDPRKASVAERMSWAAFRKTTRAEDVAYSLMGLLGVNMPLLYGEGDRAFRRLQEEIMKVSDDDSLFAWKDRFDDHNQLYNSRGMLAASPWDFRDGMSIVQSSDGAYSPYSMTNQGLQIRLPLLPIDPIRNPFGIDSENFFRTILKCTLRSKEATLWVVIYLKMIREGYYQRIFSHWLDETETHPDEKELTLLLVPQVDDSTPHNHPKIQDIEIEMLPTESGFTFNGCSLVKGYKYHNDSSYEMIPFKCQEKCFGVVIGLDNGIPWLDFIDIIDEKWSYDSYQERGSLYDAIARHLDQLSVKITREDWWVTVSVRNMGYGQVGPCPRAVVDIQRVSALPTGLYIPPLMKTGDSFDGDFLDGLDHLNIHPDFTKEGSDWFAIFNPKVKRVLDISLVHSFIDGSFVHCIQLSRDGEYLATCSRTVRIYNMETGTETCTLINKSTNIAGSVAFICFSPDSRSVATGDTEGCVKLWDIGTKHVHKVFNGHQNTISSLCFSLDARLIISGSQDGTVRIWEIVNGTSKILNMHPSYDYRHMISVWSVAISPNGELVAAGSSTGIIRIWDIVTTQLLAELQENAKDVRIAFTPDGKGLLSGGTNKVLKYRDITSITLDGKDVTKMTFMGHEGGVLSAAISHNGRWVISGSKNSSVLFWDSSNATTQFMLKTRSLHSFCLSEVGNVFVTTTGSRDGKVRVWRYKNI